MRKLLLGIAIIASVGLTAPAIAERIVIKEGYGHHHRHFRAHDRFERCRTVVVRDRRPGGTVVVRRIRKCRY